MKKIISIGTITKQPNHCHLGQEKTKLTSRPYSLEKRKKNLPMIFDLIKKLIMLTHLFKLQRVRPRLPWVWQQLKVGFG